MIPSANAKDRRIEIQPTRFLDAAEFGSRSPRHRGEVRPEFHLEPCSAGHPRIIETGDNDFGISVRGTDRYSRRTAFEQGIIQSLGRKRAELCADERTDERVFCRIDGNTMNDRTR